MVAILLSHRPSLVFQVKLPVPYQFKNGTNVYWPGLLGSNVTVPSLAGGPVTIDQVNVVLGSGSVDGRFSGPIVVSSGVIKFVLVDTGHWFKAFISQHASHHIIWFPPASSRNI